MMGTVAASSRNDDAPLNLTSFRMMLTSSNTVQCSFNDGTRTTRYHTGVGVEPKINDTIYLDNPGTMTFSGGDYWYYLGKVGDRNIHIRINNSGLVIGKTDCTL